MTKLVKNGFSNDGRPHENCQQSRWFGLEIKELLVKMRLSPFQIPPTPPFFLANWSKKGILMVVDHVNIAENGGFGGIKPAFLLGGLTRLVVGSTGGVSKWGFALAPPRPAMAHSGYCCTACCCSAVTFGSPILSNSCHHGAAFQATPSED